jgi:hypothetical protein
MMEQQGQGAAALARALRTYLAAEQEGQQEAQQEGPARAAPSGLLTALRQVRAAPRPPAARPPV